MPQGAREFCLDDEIRYMFSGSLSFRVWATKRYVDSKRIGIWGWVMLASPSKLDY